MNENVDHLATLHEIVQQARGRLPDGVWNYLVGGAESERLDDDASQPAGARFHRVPAACSARRLRRGLLDDPARTHAQRSGAARPHRLVRTTRRHCRTLHPAGGAAVAEAAAGAGVAMMLSSVAAPGLEATARAGGDDGLKTSLRVDRKNHYSSSTSAAMPIGSTITSAAPSTRATTRSASRSTSTTTHAANATSQSASSPPCV